MLDRWGARPTLALVTIVQTAALLLMPGLTDLAAFAVALGIMLGVFGQVPVSDFLIGTTASKISRSRAFECPIYGQLSCLFRCLATDCSYPVQLGI